MEIERIRIMTSDIRREERRDLKRKCDDEGFEEIYTQILQFIYFLNMYHYFSV